MDLTFDHYHHKHIVFAIYTWPVSYNKHKFINLNKFSIQHNGALIQRYLRFAVIIPTMPFATDFK